MRNGKPVTWTCSIQKECVDCGEKYWCWSDEEIEKMEVEKIEPKLLDIADMPNCSLEVKDGLHSVTEGRIFWTENNKVTCLEHGACNCVNKERTIWRCLTCHEGAYVPKIED